MKRIKGYENYSVTRDGRVWSHKTNKFLKNMIDRGRYYVKLYNSKGGQRFLLHHLVAVAFLDKTEDDIHVKWKDGCQTNNNVGNLEWCNAKQGEENHNSKLTDLDVRVIHRILEKKHIRQNRIADLFKVHESTISYIKTGKRWSHLK